MPSSIKIYAVIIALLWSIVLSLSLAWNIRQKHDETINLVMMEARSNLNKDFSILTWAISFGGVYVPVSEDIPPSPKMASITERDINTPSGRMLTLMDPVYMLTQITDSYKKKYGIKSRITSLNSLHEENVPDEWERETLLSFEQGRVEAFEFTRMDDRPYLRLMQPIKAMPICLKCHTRPGYKEGGISGGVGVAVPIDTYISMEDEQIKYLYISHSGIWLMGMLLIIYGSIRLKHNHDKRELAEARLRESRQFLQNVLDGVAEPIMLIGHDYTIKLVNQAARGQDGYLITDKPMKCHEVSHNRSTPCNDTKHPCPIDEVCLSGKPVTVMHNHKSASGHDHFVEIIASPLFDENGTMEGVIETCRDITERVRAEEQIRKSLEEKDILIKEIHHRVKNNLLVIESLLKLQSHSIKDEKDKELFTESENRVKAMSMIHERLYRSKNLVDMDFKEYINSLAVQLFHSYRIQSSGVSLQVEVEDISLDIDTIIPCGLIVNELVSNALKYAFPGEASGSITVNICKMEEGGVYKLSVKDNGKGLPDDFDIYNATTLGLQIVLSLSDQLDGKLEIVRDGGTSFELTFNERSIAE